MGGGALPGGTHDRGEVALHAGHARLQAHAHQLHAVIGLDHDPGRPGPRIEPIDLDVLLAQLPRGAARASRGRSAGEIGRWLDSFTKACKRARPSCRGVDHAAELAFGRRSYSRSTTTRSSSRRTGWPRLARDDQVLRARPSNRRPDRPRPGRPSRG